MTGSVNGLTQRTMLSLADEESGAAVVGSQDVASGEARVVAEGVTKSYGDSHVLRAVDLRLIPRSLVAIAGSNGVGKSTLLACLAGTIRHAGILRR